MVNQLEAWEPWKKIVKGITIVSSTGILCAAIAFIMRSVGSVMDRA